MTVRVKSPAYGRAALATFAEAELDSSEYGKFFDRLIPPETLVVLRSRRSPRWSPEETSEAIAALMAYRGGFIQPFLDLKPEWHWAEVDIEGVAELRSTEQPGFLELAPNLDLGTMVASLEAGKETSDGSFARRYKELRTDFLPPAVRGRPILVAKAETGPFTVMEGTTRLCAMLGLHRAGAEVEAAILVYLAVTPLRDEWPF
ncbi:MAG: hypothetical protein ABSB90_05180 [Thermoplasmata archaeon]|jgi:hypothetical protein